MSDLSAGPMRSTTTRWRFGWTSVTGLALGAAAVAVATLGTEEWVAAGYSAAGSDVRPIPAASMDAVSLDDAVPAQHGLTKVPLRALGADLAPGTRIAVGPAGAEAHFRVVSAAALPASVAAELGAHRPMMVVTARDPGSGRTVRLIIDATDGANRDVGAAAPKDL